MLWQQQRLNACGRAIALLWLIALIVSIGGLLVPEPSADSFIDPSARMLKYAIEHQYIQIYQKPGQPLDSNILDYSDRRIDELRNELAQQDMALTERQWQRISRVTRQYVAAANWGLGDPFSYTSSSEERRVSGFREDWFKYRNPFHANSVRDQWADIYSSIQSERERHGFRLLARNSELLITDRARTPELTLELNDIVSGRGVFIAKSFLLRGGNSQNLTLSIIESGHGAGRKRKLSIQPSTNARSEIAVGNGDYFVWNEIPFAVNDIDSTTNRGNLVFTKRLNGQAYRVSALGTAGTNLIGASISKFTSYIDGSIKHQSVQNVSLALDQELQFGSYALLKDTLTSIDARAPRARPRNGSVTILGVDGRILAQVGYPSFDSSWAARQRILLDRDTMMRNPARDAHRPGSTIKVFTVGAGFLLRGDAMADLLPGSNDEKAVRQAFLDAYGTRLTAPLEGATARITRDAAAEFRSKGGPSRLDDKFVNLIKNAFLYSVSKKEAEEPEVIVPDNLRNFFTDDIRSIYPGQSVFPIQDVTDIDHLRFCALGLADTRLTTLRIASTLITVSEGKVIHPYIIESVLPRGSERSIYASVVPLTDIPLDWQNVEQNRSRMMKDEVDKLKQVLLPPPPHTRVTHTGFFYRPTGGVQYLAADDPSTPDINEGQRANNDFGKSGTADYGSADEYQDSVFVYRHGKYIIAVWLEHADRQFSSPSDLPYLRHPAHRLTHRIVQLIESLE